MKILILNHHEVEQLLPMHECIEVTANALGAVSRGQVFQPLRSVVNPPGAKGLMGLMPSYLGGAEPIYGLKAITVFPGNSALGKDSHQGSVMLFRGDTGELLALMNASAITAIRTGAASGAATRLLARADAGDVAIIGSGVQARTQLAAVACVRTIRRVRVASRTLENAKRFAAEMSRQYTFPIEACAHTADAVRGADIVVTATTAATPVVQRDWLTPGAHINAVGSSMPTTRELDTATMKDARLFVDRRESLLHESGDYLYAQREGAIGPEHILAEIGEVVNGMHAGRASRDEITLFKSLGIAVEDLASAQHIYQQAQKQNVGTWVEF